MDSVLGQGAFGEVFKGILVEPLPSSRMRNVLKQSCDQYVAIKLLKSMLLTVNNYGLVAAINSSFLQHQLLGLRKQTF